MSTFDILFSVPDITWLLFSEFDPTSLALAACVCAKWRDLARRVRGNSTLFQPSFRSLVHNPHTLAWAVGNLNKKHLPPKLRGQACKIAAQERALEALKWARENGCEWGDTCIEAAKSGHLAGLQWADANGCPWYLWGCWKNAKEKTRQP